MRNLVTLLVVAVLAALTNPGCTPSGSRTYPPGRLRIATGDPGGVYHAYGEGLAKLVNRELPGVEATTVTTSASIDNLERVADGRAELAFTLADAAAEVVGRPSDAGSALVSLGRIYENDVQVVVRADGPIEVIADLRGARVSTGATGSGTELTAMRLLEVAGLAGAVEQRPMTLTDSVKALEHREIDAFVWSGGLPTAAVALLADRVPIRLLDIDELVPAMRRQYGDLYFETSIPASTYGLDQPVGTMAVPNYLVVGESMPEGLAYQLTKLLFEHQAELVASHPEALPLNLRSAIATYPLPLHPGAQRYYQEARR
ncbi:MAG: TAXI family TRAP transporter solute-binding subunit [Egibacteraceae bacterium]